jgi:hypothetical protein
LLGLWSVTRRKRKKERDGEKERFFLSRKNSVKIKIKGEKENNTK